MAISTVVLIDTPWRERISVMLLAAGMVATSELQTKAVPVAQTCRLLGVSLAGFYEAKRHGVAPTFCKASVHLRAAFASSGQSYGSRRLVSALANGGLQIGRYKYVS